MAFSILRLTSPISAAHGGQKRVLLTNTLSTSSPFTLKPPLSRDVFFKGSTSSESIEENDETNEDDEATSEASESETKPEYKVTNRGIPGISALYPKWVLNNLRKTDHILDVAAGGGQFVTDLQNKGHKNAYGIDLQEESDFVGLLDFTDLGESHFRGKQDHIFSTWGPFSYPSESEDKQLEGLKQMAACAKKGGRIYLAPVDSTLICRLAAYVPKLEVIETGQTEAEPQLEYVVFKKH